MVLEKAKFLSDVLGKSRPDFAQIARGASGSLKDRTQTRDPGTLRGLLAGQGRAIFAEEPQVE
jgi:hypothetical protein